MDSKPSFHPGLLHQWTLFPDYTSEAQLREIFVMMEDMSMRFRHGGRVTSPSGPQLFPKSCVFHRHKGSWRSQSTGFRWFPQIIVRKCSSYAHDTVHDRDETDKHPTEIFFHWTLISAACRHLFLTVIYRLVEYAPYPARASSKGCSCIFPWMDLQEGEVAFMEWNLQWYKWLW